MYEMELDWLKKWDMYSPQGVALLDGETDHQLTYAELYKKAKQAAAYLKNQFQISKGDRVAVMATNELEHVVLLFACQRLGAILIPVNFRLTPREVAHILKDSSPKLFLYQNDYEGLVQELSAHVALPAKAFFTGEGSFFSAAYSHIEEYAKFDGMTQDPCMIIYTSGTTGAPKGALLSNSMLFWNSINTTLRLNINQSDCFVSFLPFFHTGGFNVLTTPYLHRGAKVVVVKKFDADRILELSAKHKATLLFGVPTTMDLLSQSPLFASADLSSIRYAIVGGEPMPIKLIEKWHEKKIPIRQGYGLTEFGPNVFSLNEQDAIRKKGSIGFPNFYIEAKVVDDNNSEVGNEEVGELVLKGPSCMLGYWNNLEATAKTIVDGWLHTGDLVRKDSEGYFYVVGRKKDMYKSGGENVYPPELEQVLRQMPEIKEAAVIGVKDEKWGEVGRAFIVAAAPNLTEELVLKFCQSNLAKFKIPKYFTFVKELPKGESGKILKRQLPELYPL